jgi:hypothetical protein
LLSPWPEQRLTRRFFAGLASGARELFGLGMVQADAGPCPIAELDPAPLELTLDFSQSGWLQISFASLEAADCTPSYSDYCC